MRALTLAAAFALLAPGLGTQRLASGSIAGEVRTVDGMVAVGLRVSALAVPDGNARGAGADVTLTSLAQTDNSGRFLLEDLPPGRYYVMAGLLDFPTYYPGVKTQADARIVTIGAGAAASAINFVLARPAGVRVSGRVNGIPAETPAGIFRVALLPSGSAASSAMETLVQSDGTFELLKVSPGRYTARLTPAIGATTTSTIQVDDKDIPNVGMTVSAFVLGRVAVDDGSKLPVQMQAIAAGAPDQSSLVQLRGTRVDSAGVTVPVALANAPNGLILSTAIARAGATISATVRADGYFIFNAPAGAYQLAATLLPFGYSLKSAAMDPAGSRLDVTLTAAPLASEPPGVRVSGRVTGFAPAGTTSHFVSISVTVPAAASSSPLSLQRIGQAPILPDGSFEVQHVPPGPATIQVYSGTTSNMSMRLDVSDRDMTIELAVANGAAPRGGAPATLPVAAPAAPITITIPGPPGSALPAASRAVPAPDAGIPPSAANVPMPAASFRISGAITGVAPIADEAFPTRSIALIQGSLQQFQALIFSDNSFEFPHIPPGSYNVRLSLGLTYLLSKPLVVEDKDLIGLEIAAPGR